MDNINKSIEVGRLLTQVLGLLKKNVIKGFENTGLTFTQVTVIGILAKDSKMKISELSSYMGLSNSTVSGIVDRLEQQGVIVRERSKKDRRVVYVSLSPNSKEMFKGFHETIHINIEKFMNKATSEELDKIDEGLNILKKLLTD